MITYHYHMIAYHGQHSPELVPLPPPSPSASALPLLSAAAAEERAHTHHVTPRDASQSHSLTLSLSSASCLTASALAFFRASFSDLSSSLNFLTRGSSAYAVSGAEDGYYSSLNADGEGAWPGHTYKCSQPHCFFLLPLLSNCSVLLLHPPTLLPAAGRGRGHTSQHVATIHMPVQSVRAWLIGTTSRGGTWYCPYLSAFSTFSSSR